MIRPHRQYQCLAILVFDFGHIGLWPNAKPEARLNDKGWIVWWLLATVVARNFVTSQRWRRDWSLIAGKDLWLLWRQNTVMIRYLWFDQWLAANRPMIMTNAWVTSREDGLRQVAKSRAAFYTRSRCLWPAWATSVYTEIREQCPANNWQIRFSNGDRIGQNILLSLSDS